MIRILKLKQLASEWLSLPKGYAPGKMANRKLYSGIILAGGKAIRLGMDKGLIELHGKKLIEYAIETLSPFCNEIMISSNNPDYNIFPYRIIPDLASGKGPMMGIYSALKASRSYANLILAVDNIFVTRAFFRYLLSMDLSEYHVAVPFIQNKYFEPLVGYYSVKCIPAMEHLFLVHNYKLPDLFPRIPVNKLMVERDFPDFKQNYFQSLNHTEDLLLLDEVHPGQ